MHEDSEDAFISVDEQKTKLEERLEEIQDALQKSETKSVDAQEQTSNGQGVGSRNPKRKKASQKGKKKR